MDPAAFAFAFVAAGIGTLVFDVRDHLGRIAGAAGLAVLTPLAFWAADTGWVWAIIAAVVVGWAVWCAVRLICALLA